MSVKGFKDDMYASLPRSLKNQLIVRTKVEENEEVLEQRQALVESKSPAELSEIHNLGELPIPSRIEAWLHGSNGDAERYLKELLLPPHPFHFPLVLTFCVWNSDCYCYTLIHTTPNPLCCI